MGRCGHPFLGLHSTLRPNLLSHAWNQWNSYANKGMQECLFLSYTGDLGIPTFEICENALM